MSTPSAPKYADPRDNETPLTAEEKTAIRWVELHQEAMKEFKAIYDAQHQVRELCLEDRKFAKQPGGQWLDKYGQQFENRPKLEINKIGQSNLRTIAEYRNNRISTKFVAKDGKETALADVCNGLMRANEQDSDAEQAYDNAFDEAVTGGFGAIRLTEGYEDEDDPDNEQLVIKFESIYDADKNVWFDNGAKNQNKSDAKCCFVLNPMTLDAYKAEWDDNPDAWPEEVTNGFYDWWNKIDSVIVAEWYRVEKVNYVRYTWTDLEGTETVYTKEDFKDDPELEDRLIATGSRLTGTRKWSRRKIHKYLLSGGTILEDCGYVAGEYIPIIPQYGQRWYIDGIEQIQGKVRPAKDPQRIYNMLVSRMLETAVLSGDSIPIVTPEQIAMFETEWAEANLKNLAFKRQNMVVNAITGEKTVLPIQYSQPANPSPAVTGLIGLAGQDIQDVLGFAQGNDKVVANVSAEAMQIAQNNIDLGSYIYISNAAKAQKWKGTVWLSKAKEVYQESGRIVKTLDATNNPKPVTLGKLTVKDGKQVVENDLSDAKFDVAVDVGPTSKTQRDALIRSMQALLMIPNLDPQTAQVLVAEILMNQDGEGTEDVQEFARKMLVKLNVSKPNEEDRAEMAKAAQQQQTPSANDQYLAAAAKEADAKSQQAQADAMKTLAEIQQIKADVDKTKMETMELLAKIDMESKESAAQLMTQIQALLAPQSIQPGPLAQGGLG